MKVFVHGQEKAWIRELNRLCGRDQIYFCEEKEPFRDIHLIITDFPIEESRKGILLKIPFLVVSREKREEKILEAFRKGAEDYMIYPVSPRIARARILRILNHFKKEREYLKKICSHVHFTPNEYKILSVLTAYPGRAVSRNELIERAFSDSYDGFDRNIDNYVKEIRKKMNAEFGKRNRIETVYGIGYRYLP